MAADALALTENRSALTMVLTMQDEQAIAVHEVQFQLPVPRW